MGAKSYFTDKEIECRCGCGFKGVQPPFLYKMNDLRHYFGSPIHPTSFCRCAGHNAKVGGSVTSSHPKGWACDILIPSELGKYKLLIAAGKVGFRGIGIGKTFIHLDDDPNKPGSRIWLY